MDVAVFYSRRIMAMAIVLGFVTSGGILVFRPLIPTFFRLEPESIEDIKRILLVKAAFSPLITFNWTNVIGILRSGGDTFAGLMLDIIPLWFVAVPVSFAGALYFGWPIEIVILAGSMEEVIKMAFGVPRVLKNKWVNNIAV